MRASVPVSRAVVWALLGALALLPARADAVLPTAPTSACPVTTQVAGIGKACLLPGGLWRITLPDGYEYDTHGPDAKYTEIDEIIFFHKLGTKSPSCITDPSKQFHVQVIFAKPTDVNASRYVTTVPKIRDTIGKVNAMLDMEARAFGVPSMRYRMRCTRGAIDIPRINLTTTRKTTTVEGVVTAVRQAGYTNPYAKYWVWVDIPPQGGIAGISDFTGDSDPGPDNGNNMGPNYGLFYGLLGGYGAEVIMHEASHGMGAVQSDAPNNNPGGQGGYAQHCNDDPDVMCYKEAAGSTYKPDSCARVYFDCRHDDYFNPRPKRGKYLYDHWNLASPHNRYFASCTYSTGVLTAGTAGQDLDSTIKSVHPDWTAIASGKHSVPKACWGHPFSANAITMPPAVPGNHPESWAVWFVMVQNASRRVQMAPPADVDACFYKGSKLLKCYAAGVYESGTVPSGATSVRVALVAGANATYVFSAV